MIKVNFGEKIVECEAPITVYEAARAGELVSRATLACEIGGEICALSKELNADADVKLKILAAIEDMDRVMVTQFKTMFDQINNEFNTLLCFIRTYIILI